MGGSSVMRAYSLVTSEPAVALVHQEHAPLADAAGGYLFMKLQNHNPSTQLRIFEDRDL